MMKTIIILLVFLLGLSACTSSQQKSSEERLEYAKYLRAPRLQMTKKQYSSFLNSELVKKQGELSALEGMRRNEETLISNDEQREREISSGSSEATLFTIGNTSRRISLHDIEIRMNNARRSLFEIRTLQSELQ